MSVSLVQTVYDRAFKRRESHDAFYRELYRDDLERLNTMGLAGIEGGAGDTAADGDDSWSEKVYEQLEAKLRVIFAIDRGSISNGESMPNSGPLTAPRRMIELGAGSGNLSCRLASPSLQASLIDIEPYAVAVARRIVDLQHKTSYINVAEGDLFDLPREPRYDIAFSVGVFEELNTQARADFVQLGFDLLRPGGIFLIAVPSFVSPTMLWLWRRHGKASEVFLPQAYLRRLLRRAGFARVQSSGLGPVIPKPGYRWADRSLSRWLGMLAGVWGVRPDPSRNGASASGR